MSDYKQRGSLLMASSAEFKKMMENLQRDSGLPVTGRFDRPTADALYKSRLQEDIKQAFHGGKSEANPLNAAKQAGASLFQRGGRDVVADGNIPGASLKEKFVQGDRNPAPVSLETLQNAPVEPTQQPSPLPGEMHFRERPSEP